MPHLRPSKSSLAADTFTVCLTCGSTINNADLATKSNIVFRVFAVLHSLAPTLGSILAAKMILEALGAILVEG